MRNSKLALISIDKIEIEIDYHGELIGSAWITCISKKNEYLHLIQINGKWFVYIL